MRTLQTVFRRLTSNLGACSDIRYKRLKPKLLLPALALCILSSIGSACASGVQPTLVPALMPAATAAPTLGPFPGATPTTATAASSGLEARGSFFALSVADINATSEWYTEKLGLESVMQPPKANGVSVIVLEGDGLIVELIQNDKAKPLSVVAPAITDKMLVYGIVKVGIIVDDLDQTVTTLKERNVPILFGPFPASADQRANLIIEDNEGNLIQFFGE